jgi:error-prone DNA polymerase
MDVHRHALTGLGVTPLAACARGTRVRTAGLVAQRQRPPTANGVAFWWLEDGFTRAQAIIPPALWEAQRVTLRDARILIVEGVFRRDGEARTIAVERLWSFQDRARQAVPVGVG